MNPPFDRFPDPPSGKTGWPWTAEAPPPAEEGPWPKISIVTPSLNQARFIEETIRSVLMQGYPNLEYIVIDGGSNDGSVEVIRKYEPWISYWTSEKDKGQSDAINKGFERCTGDIMTFQNSDDYYLPGAFVDVARRWRGMKSADGAIVGGFMPCDEDSRARGPAIPAHLHASGPVDLTLGPPGKYRMHQASVFYLREALDEVGRWVREDLHYVMDRELLYRVCRKYPVIISDAVYGAFRSHANSKSTSDTLPFAREFADLYAGSITGIGRDDRRRRMMVQHRLTDGYLKHARGADSLADSASYCINALVCDPSLAFRPKFWRACVKMLAERIERRGTSRQRQ
jgi:glycosyltransferase involved in cell wall biosynthesis